MFFKGINFSNKCSHGLFHMYSTVQVLCLSVENSVFLSDPGLLQSRATGKVSDLYSHS